VSLSSSEQQELLAAEQPTAPRPAPRKSIEELLRARYAAPHFAFLEQMRAGAGFDQRTADAIAMGLWKSQGLHLHGFEIKRDKRDLKRELVDPSKAEAVLRFCDFWWLVADDEKVYQGLEVPAHWGILVRTKAGDVLRVERKATQLADPTPMTRGFLARVLKGAADASPAAMDEQRREEEISHGVEKRIAEIRESHRLAQATQSRAFEERLKTRDARVVEFEKASGIRIDDWQAGHIGAAVRLLLQLKPSTFRAHVGELERSAGELLATIKQVRAEAARQEDAG
jgi:hypothetical protein